MLFHTLGRKGIDVGLGCPLVQLLVEQPAGKVTQGYLDTQLQETGGTVDSYQAGAQYYHLFLPAGGQHILGHLLQDLDVIDITEADHILGPGHILDRREEGVGPGGNQQLVVGHGLSLVQKKLFILPVKANNLHALHPLNLVEVFKVCLHKAESFKGSLPGQVLMEYTAGINVFILGDQNDLTLLISFP